MLDGRVLGASQVEYKPFGKPPLQREPQRALDMRFGSFVSARQAPFLKTLPGFFGWLLLLAWLLAAWLGFWLVWLASGTIEKKMRNVAAGVLHLICRNPLNLHTPRAPCYMCYMCYMGLTRQPAELPHCPAPCYMCYMCYMGLTRQPAEPPLSPSSLLYVLYVLYILYARNLYYMCYIGHIWYMLRCYVYSIQLCWLACKTHIAHIAHVARSWGRVGFSGLACKI